MDTKMHYFLDPAGGVYAFSDAQIEMGYPLTPMAQIPESEVEAHVNKPKTAQQLREEWKSRRAAAVADITVTTMAGNTFDGDETSQGRMARAITALGATPDGTVNWVLADNTVITATATELTEALALAGAAQATLWVAA